MSEYLLLIWMFFKIGLFTIGGGYAMLPLINSELVAHGLMTQMEVADIIAISEITPGPFAINAATFAGVKLLGIPGGVAATGAIVLPSLIITTLLARYFYKFEDNIIVRRALWGLRPAVTGLIAAAAAVMAAPAFFGVGISQIKPDGIFLNMDYCSIAIAVLAGIAIIKFKVSPILIILIAGALGVLLFGVLGL
ncbi:MAG: chromate transporter [Christensenellales bacterium]